MDKPERKFAIQITPGGGIIYIPETKERVPVHTVVAKILLFLLDETETLRAELARPVERVVLKEKPKAKGKAKK